MWAPEIHHIDNTWYYFYSSCDASQACCDSCQTRVLKGCDGPNPYDCDYEFLATLVPPEGSRGSSSNLAFSIDGSYLEIPGRGRYHVLSIVDEKRLQSIAITELNTTDWTVNAWHIISQPDQEWEQHYKGNGAVNEAPHVSVFFPRKVARC
jgi:GH43 family beta-xylosidase